MASELLQLPKKTLAFSSLGVNRLATERMRRDFQFRISALILAFATVAAVVLAGINFSKERQYPVPDDGVWWMEAGNGIYAQRVIPGGPADKRGIKPGDLLISVNDQVLPNVAALQRQLSRVGIWSSATYQLDRNGVKIDVPVILTEADKSLNQGMRLIAVFYLGIGLYVLLRRWTAPKSTHFFIFCLVSFILYSFKYTGKLNDFDWIIYWCSVVAGLLQPALFLHFVLTFPEKKHFVSRHPWIQPAVYIPGLLLLALHLTVLRTLQASELLRWNLDRLEMLYLATFFVVAAGVLWHSYRVASTTILRQQMKWVTRGTIVAITPFTLFYVMPYLQGTLPTMAMKVSVLSLIFLPLT